MPRLDRINEWIGRGVAWLTLAMVINTVVIVVARDLFDFGRIWLQEATTWMHATVFLLGAAYTLRHDEQVRVDIFYRRFTPRTQAWVNIGGILLLLLPVCALLLITSWDYVFGARGSWASLEGSRQSGGLPYPATPILKTIMFLMPVLLALQALVDLAANVGRLRRPGDVA